MRAMNNDERSARRPDKAFPTLAQATAAARAEDLVDIYGVCVFYDGRLQIGLWSPPPKTRLCVICFFQNHQFSSHSLTSTHKIKTSK
jgi:hypothetical protein